jgi:hypothetical protein
VSVHVRAFLFSALGKAQFLMAILGAF